jgi:hypothetical protein
MNEQMTKGEEVRYSVSAEHLDQLLKLARELKRPECPYNKDKTIMMQHVIDSSMGNADMMVDILEEYGL